MIGIHLRTKKTLEVWQVEKDNETPKWVRQAFVSGNFQWHDKSLFVRNIGGLLKIKVPLGDYLVFNGKYLKAVPKVKFSREYRVD